DASHFVHRATIPGLAAETSYVYRVRSGTNATPTFSFTTAPRPTSPFVTAWWGDNHAGTVTLATHVTNLLAHAPNMICVAGDMVNSGNSLSGMARLLVQTPRNPQRRPNHSRYLCARQS